MNPILSIVICGRNDNYMGNSNWRLETTINFLASEVSKINKLKDIELIVVDWGSNIPLFCTLTLNQTAKQIIRFINVPISVATKTGEEGVFSDVIGVNVGIRRALGDFITFSVSDILFTKSFLEKLFDILTGKYKIGEKVDKSLFIFNRKDVPIEIVNQDFNLSQISKYIEENGKKLPLPPLTPFYLAPSGAMMMHRCLWHDSHALDQRLIYRGWSDIDLCLRMRLKYSVVDMSEEEDMCLYHLDHYKPTVIHRKINQLVINPFGVNAWDWGLANQEFEEFPKKIEFNPQCRNEMKKVVSLPDLNFRRKHLLCLIKFLIRNLSFGNLKFATSHSILIFEQYPENSIQRIIYFCLKLLRAIYRVLKKLTKYFVINFI